MLTKQEINNICDSTDLWGDNFEDIVAKALIATFETNVIELNFVKKKDRLKIEHVLSIRKKDLYIPSRDRIVISDSGIKTSQQFDIANDSIPENGFIAYPTSIENELNGYYLNMGAFKEIETLPDHWRRTSKGRLFMHWCIYVNAQGLSGNRSFYNVDEKGIIRACDMKGYRQIPHLISNTLKAFNGELQLTADRKFCWGITANESNATATIGCSKEEIKSLLYARSLPLTATGRKRPILHLVEAHRRRLKNGIDINIDNFLKGVASVEMDGTKFTVVPPSILLKSISDKKKKD